MVWLVMANTFMGGVGIAAAVIALFDDAPAGIIAENALWGLANVAFATFVASRVLAVS